MSISKNHYLSLEIIWNDDDMIELKVEASNSRYFGTTEVYETSDTLLQLARDLEGFPFAKKEVKYNSGEQGNNGYVHVAFHNISATGRCGVVITLEEDIKTEQPAIKVNKATFELLVEPYAIDNFIKELRAMSNSEKGKCLLKGLPFQ